MKIFKASAIVLKVFTVAFLFSLAACNHPFFDREEPGGGKPPKPPVVNDCNQTGKLVTVGCGPSIYGNLWILSATGEYLRPCEQSFVTLCPIPLYDGDEVKYSYRKINNCNKCKNEIACLGMIPKHTHVIIDCINAVTSSDCGTLIGDENSSSDNNYIHVLEARVEGRYLKLKIGYSGCNTLTKDDFKLTWNGAYAKSLPAQVTLNVGLNVEPTMCQAYFTTELCYDINMLKMGMGPELLVRIGDKTVLF